MGKPRVIIQIILERIIVLQKEIGMVFAPFQFENDYRLWSETGYGFRGRYTVVFYEYIDRLVPNEREMKP